MNAATNETTFAVHTITAGCRAKRNANSPFHAGPYQENGALVLGESFLISDYRRMETLNDNRIADFVAVWEGEAGQWDLTAPLVIRFETIDVVVRPRATGKDLTVWLGCVNTDMPINATRNNTLANRFANRYGCLQWLSRSSLRPYIGAVVKRAWIETAGGAIGAQTACARALRFCLALEDGRILTLSNDRGALAITCVEQA